MNLFDKDFPFADFLGEGDFSGIFFDPEDDNNIMDYGYKGSIKLNDRQYRDSMVLYADNKERMNDNWFAQSYNKIVKIYTNGSNTINSTLCKLGSRESEKRSILSRVNGEYIDLDEFDELISCSKMSIPTIVYTGSYVDLNAHRSPIINYGYTSTTIIPHVAKDFGIKKFIKSSGHIIKHVLKIEIPKGFPHLFAENGTNFPGQMELILPRKVIMDITYEPLSIITGRFVSHLQPLDHRICTSTPLKIYIWGTVLGDK